MVASFIVSITQSILVWTGFYASVTEKSVGLIAAGLSTFNILVGLYMINSVAMLTSCL